MLHNFKFLGKVLILSAVCFFCQAAMSQTGNIGDFIWEDLNDDKVQDGGEPGISGVTVFIDLNNNGNLDSGESSTVTDDAGAYNFIGLSTGTYVITVDNSTLPSGFNVGAPNFRVLVDLADDEDYNDADFGFHKHEAFIGDFVWNDLNGDGVQDVGESGMSGINIYIDYNTNGVFDGGDFATPTDVSGAYLLSALSPGTYSVGIDTASIPTGFNLTNNNGFVSMVLGEDEAVYVVDFGLQQQDASIGDFVWDDVNINGIQDESESGLPGITVYLDLNSNGAIDGGEPSTITDAIGAFDFTDLPMGTYILNIDETTLPPNYELTSPSITITINLAAGEDFNEADFGFALPIVIPTLSQWGLMILLILISIFGVIVNRAHIDKRQMAS